MTGLLPPGRPAVPHAITSGRRRIPAQPQQVPADAPAEAERCEQLFVSQLSTIAGVISFIARRHRLRADAAEEFSAHVYLKLIADSYSVFRRFEGRSSLRTYLTVVIQRIFLDYRVSQWGKWRPSALARREGPTATLLERLTMRQGLSFEHACTVLETVHHVTVGRRALETLYERLPLRTQRRFVGCDALATVCARDGGPDSGVAAEVSTATAARTSRALAAALADLPIDDRRLIAMRYVDGVSVADIARATSRDYKVLYRQFRRVLMEIRGRLEREGICQSDVAELLGHPEVELPPVGLRSDLAIASEAAPQTAERLRLAR